LTNLEWVMDLATRLLGAALTFPAWHGDRQEDPELRAELYRPTMVAIASVARSRQEASVLLAQAIEDTHLARYVLEGRCKDGPPGQRCDNGHARGPFQVHGWCTATDLRGEARCALRAALGGQARCEGRSLTPLHAAFVGLAARECNWRGADHRVQTARKIERMLAEARP
jgi:hypothetical protein